MTDFNHTLVGGLNYICEETSNWQNVLFAVLTTLIGVTSILVNATAAIVFLRCNILQTPNNILVFSLAISDLCFTLVSCPTLLLIYTIDIDADATLSLKLSGLFMLFFACVSITTKVCISMHRYLSVVKPKCTYFSSMKRAGLLIPLTWIISSMCSIAPLFGWGTYSPEVLVVCRTGVSQDWTYRAFLMAMVFVLPLTMMSVFYFQIYKVIMEHSRVMDRGHVGKTKLLKVEQKTNSLMFAVLMAFCVSWMPFHIISICLGFLGNDVPVVVVSMAAMLACSSPISNFLLYAVANRAYYKSILRIIFCRGPIARETTPPLANETLAGFRSTNHNHGSVAPADIQIPNVMVTITRETDRELEQMAMERKRSTSKPPTEIDNEIQQRKRSVHRLSVIMLGELNNGCNFEYHSGSITVQESWASPTRGQNLERVGEMSESPKASVSGSPFLTVESVFERRRMTFGGDRPILKKEEPQIAPRKTVATTRATVHVMGKKKKRRTLKSSALKSNELDSIRKSCSPEGCDQERHEDRTSGDSLSNCLTERGLDNLDSTCPSSHTS